MLDAMVCSYEYFIDLYVSVFYECFIGCYGVRETAFLELNVRV